MSARADLTIRRHRLTHSAGDLDSASIAAARTAHGLRRGLTLKLNIVRCIGSIVLLALVAGCNNPKEKFGKIYYLDGAGNWGFGVTDVPAGLQAAGYPGDVEVYVWTTSFSPAIDQVNIVANKLRAAGLTGKIKDYLTRYPSNKVNMIALSAGTGIAVWAVEGLPDGMMIENMVLLGSSLSYNYDMRQALRHVRGKVYVFHSGHDEVLTSAVRALGTVDRTNEDSAGLVGLRPPGGGGGKVVNNGWSAKYTRYGWTGAHTDATSQAFIQAVVAPLVTGGQRRGDGTDRVTSMTPIGPKLAATLP